MFAGTRAGTAGRDIGTAGIQKGLLTHRLPTVEAVGHFETRCQIPTKRRKRVTGDAPMEREEEEVGAHAYAGKANFAEVQEVLRGGGREGVGGDGRGRRPKRDRRGIGPAGGLGLGGAGDVAGAVVEVMGRGEGRGGREEGLGWSVVRTALCWRLKEPEPEPEQKNAVRGSPLDFMGGPAANQRRPCLF